MVKIESLDKLAGGLRAKFLRDEIELLKKRIEAQEKSPGSHAARLAADQSSSHIHTAIVVLEDQLYVLKGTGLHDDG